MANPKSVSQRRINVKTLFSSKNPNLFRFVLYLSQVGDAFRQLDDHAAKIFHHRQQHAAHVIHLNGAIVAALGSFELTYRVHFQHAVHQIGDVVAELLFQRFVIKNAFVR